VPGDASRSSGLGDASPEIKAAEAQDLTPEQNLKVQSAHPLESASRYDSVESYIIHLLHRHAYEEAGRLGFQKEVLDWGCNDGWGLEILAQNGCKVSGLDISSHAIEAARQRLGSDVELILYDGNASGLPADRFDLVSSFQCIEHVVDPGPYILEIKRVLKPGGIAIFTTPNACIRLSPGMKPWNPFHVREFTALELESLLSSYFSKVEVKGLFANEPIQSIEVARCDRNRRMASSKIRQKEIDKKALRLLRRMLPTALVVRMKKITGYNQKRDFDTYSTSELFYRRDHLDSSLDLMAICRD
jgi:2-polyprenyl-3-methyl-5-hydroxy-6-metoxy-1,4-benzoquinol methylase